MTLRLAFQFALQLLLGGNLDNLIVDDTVGKRNIGQETEQVCGNAITVDGYRQIRLYDCRHVDHVHIHQREGTNGTVTDGQVLVAGLEVVDAVGIILETDGHEAVQVVAHIILVQFVVPDVLVRENIAHFRHLGMEVHPFFGVVLDEHVLVSLLRDDEEGADVGIFPALKVAEVTLREKFHAGRNVMMIAFLAENVLLLKGIAFTQCLHDVAQHVTELHIQLSISAEARHWILYFKDDGTIALLRPEYGVQKSAALVLDVLKLGKESVKRSFLCAHSLSFNDCTDLDRQRFPCHAVWHGVRCAA